MRGRNLVILAVILVLLIVIAILVMREPPAEKITASFPEIKKEQVTKVWIKTPVKDEKNKEEKKEGTVAKFDEVTLEKKTEGENSRWMVTSPVFYEAYQSYVDSMLSRLEDLKIESVAAENLESYKKLEIDADHATEVKVFKGNEMILNFFVGGYKGGATMVRFPKDNRVYRVRGSIGYLFAKPVRDWREKRIIDVENDNVTRLEFVNQSGKFSFSKVENNWRNESLTPIPDYDPKKISGFVSTVAHLRASDFEDKLKPEEAGITENSPRVTMFYTEKKQSTRPDATTETDAQESAEAQESPATLSETVIIGNKKDESNYFVKLASKPQIFVISKYTAERLTPAPDKFATPVKKETSKPAEDVASRPDASTEDYSIPPEVMKKIQAEIKKKQLLKQLASQPQ